MTVGIGMRARRAWHLAILATAGVGDEDPLRRRWLRDAIAWQQRTHAHPNRYVPVDHDRRGDPRVPYRLAGLSRAERRRHIRESVRGAA